MVSGHLKWLFSLVMSALVFCGAIRVAQAKRNPVQNQDDLPFTPPPYVELCQQAIVANDLDAAIRVLKAAQACWAEHHERCGFTELDYDSLAGVVYLERGLTEKAVQSLEGVVAGHPNRTMVWFYLGQAYLRLSRYRKAAEALTQAAAVGKNIPQYHAMLVRAWKGTNEDERARAALAAGLRRFPDDAPLLYEGTTLYLSKGLFLAARDLARRHAAAPGEHCDLAFLMVATSYRREGWRREAITTLEEATLLCGYNSQAAIRLAYIYAEDGHPLSAARLFERLSSMDSSFLHAASEQYRLAEHMIAAHRLAARIENETNRRAQLAVVHLHMGNVDTVVQLLAPLFEAGVLDDQGIFRLAYAALRSDRFDLAKKLLDRRQEAPLDDSESRLRRVLARCETYPWECW